MSDTLAAANHDPITPPPVPWTYPAPPETRRGRPRGGGAELDGDLPVRLPVRLYHLPHNLVRRGFPTTMIARSIPRDNAAVQGLIEGAQAAIQKVDQVRDTSPEPAADNGNGLSCPFLSDAVFGPSEPAAPLDAPTDPSSVRFEFSHGFVRETIASADVLANTLISRPSTPSMSPCLSP